MLGAEQSVIGCLMMDPALLDKARTMLAPKMFEAEPLARIFSCMLKLKKAGMPVDPVTVVSKLGAAVSYTHLDVYKRQSVKSRSCASIVCGNRFINYIFHFGF